MSSSPISIDLLPVNIAIYRYDNGDFVFTDFNLQAQKTENIDKSELIGRPVTEVFPGIGALGLLDVFERVRQTGTPERLEAAYYRDEVREGWRINDVSRLDDGRIMAVYQDVTHEVNVSQTLQTLGTLVDNSVNEIYIFDPVTLRFSYANQSAIRNTGYTADLLMRLTPLDLKTDMSEQEFRTMLAPLTKESASFVAFETRHRRNDGTYYDVEARIQRMMIDGTVRFFVIVTDISERKAYQNEQLKLLRIIEQTDDLIMITDRDGTIEYVNEAYTVLTGWGRRELVGNKPSMLKSGKYSEGFYDHFWATIIAGATYHGMIQNRKKDGTLYWEEKTITPIRMTGEEITHFVSTGKDITDQIAIREALKESEQLFKTLAANTLAGIFMYQDRYIYANAMFCTMTGYSADELMTMNPADVIAPEDRAMITANVSRRLSGALSQPQVYSDLRIMTKRGEIRWVYAATTTVRFHGNLTGLGTIIDITDRKVLEEQLAQAAVTDRLTGLYNRMKFDDIIARETAAAARYTTPLALIMFDIDFFKVINDALGHDAGDRVLVQIAEIARSAVRGSDYLFRWGGEEFVVVAPHTAHDEALALAERLRETIEHASFGNAGSVTVSAGVALSIAGEAIDETLRRADQAMYDAKGTGRNRVCSR